MSTKMRIAFGCHFLATLLMAAFGLAYVLKTEFMPYHAIAVGLPWSEVTPSFQVLILALMRAAGGAGLAVVVLELFLLLLPFRRGEVWARWAVPAGGLVISFGALYAMLYVSLNTQATPPLIAPVAGILLFVVGFAVSLAQPRGADVGA